MATTIHWKPIYGIQIALTEAGESQRDLADRLGWNEVRVSKILNGKQKLTVDDLIDIAKAQKREISWYFEPPPPRPELASPLSLDLGQAGSPRYVKLQTWVDRPTDNRPPSREAA